MKGRPPSVQATNWDPTFTFSVHWGEGIAQFLSAGLVTEKLCVCVAGEFSSPRQTFWTDSYFGICPPAHTSPSPMLPQDLNIQDPDYSAKSTGGRLQLNTHAPYIWGSE